MKKKFYFIIAILISLIPFNNIRITLYKFIFKYKLISSKIGWLTIINVNSLNMTSAQIRGFSMFIGPMDITLNTNSIIGSFNFFRCRPWVLEYGWSHQLILDREAEITIQHFFDVSGQIYLGKNSIIAGARSQFWTHGNISDSVDIYIGNNCYIGSGTKFSPNTKISDDSLLAMGSVITKRFEEKNLLLAGVPAKIIRKNVNWRENWK